MRIYVASSFLNKVPAKALMTRLEKLGHKITVDWTEHDDTSDPKVLARHAEIDKAGVETADALVLLCPFRYSSMVETGIALANDKPVFVVGEHNAPGACLFFHHYGVRKVGADELIVRLKELGV